MTTSQFEHLNPTSLPDAGAMGYSQIVKCRPGEFVFISGQVAWSRDGSAVPSALAPQSRLVVSNLGEALKAAGAKPQNVVSLRMFVVDLEPGMSEIVIPALRSLFGEHQPAVTAVGVTSLAAPDLLLEIEAIAVI